MKQFFLRNSYRIWSLYLLSVIFVSLSFTDTAPTIGHTMCQFVLAVMGFLPLYIAIRGRMGERGLFGSVFLYFILGGTLITWLFVDLYDDRLGFNPLDANLYRNLAINFSDQGWSYLIQHLNDRGFALDDYGFPLIQNTMFAFLGQEIAPIGMLLLNALCVSIGAVFLSRLIGMHTDDKRLGIIGGIIWGILPFGVYTAVAGLKENFFAFLVIVAFYGFYQWHRVGGGVKYLSLFIIGTLGVVFFRIPIIYMILASVLTFFILRRFRIRRYMIPLSLLAVLVAYMLFDQILSFSYAQKGYNDAGRMLVGTQARIAETGNIFVANVINYLSVIIGPFPNLHSNSEKKISYITLYSLTGFIKCFISFFFIYACYLVVKEKIVRLIPFLVFWGLHALMLVITFYSMDDRFQWPHISIYILITFWGIQQYFSRSPDRRYLFYYSFGVTIMIIVFNLRFFTA